jgi:putative thioredoxin
MAVFTAASSSLDPLLREVETNPTSLELRYKLAEAQMGVGQHAKAIESALSVVAASPSWEDGKAKALCLRIFESLGNSHPAVQSGRKRLSKLLFR